MKLCKAVLVNEKDKVTHWPQMLYHLIKYFFVAGYKCIGKWKNSKNNIYLVPYI